MRLKPRSLSVRRLLVPVLLLSLTAGAARADAPADTSVHTAASLRVMLLHTPEAPAAGPFEPAPGGSGRRVVPLAFAASAVVPGLGQAYNRHWIKAAAALLVEAALVYGYVDTHQRGLDGEEAFRTYARAHWSPAQYASWLEDYSDWLPNVDRAEIDASLVQGLDFTQPDAWTTAEWQRVQSFFRQVQAAEGAVYHPETGASFSHKLPLFGEQQYYELIGKYFQFAPGWEDYPAWKEGETFTDAIDPEKTGPNGQKVNVQGRFWEYDDLSERANDLLRDASRLTAFMIVNHLVAAVDAAIFAKLHNDRLETDLTLAYDAYGTLRPHAALRLRF